MLKIIVNYPEPSSQVSAEDITTLMAFDNVIREHSVPLFSDTSNPRWELDTTVQTPKHFCLKIGINPSRNVITRGIDNLRHITPKQFHNLLVEASLNGNDEQGCCE